MKLPLVTPSSHSNIKKLLLGQKALKEENLELETEVIQRNTLKLWDTTRLRTGLSKLRKECNKCPLTSTAKRKTNWLRCMKSNKLS